MFISLLDIKTSPYMAPYSQFIAFKALAKAAFRSITKSPSSVIFTIAFPLIFIIGFGFIGGDNSQRKDLGILETIDTTSIFYQSLQKDALVNLIEIPEVNLKTALENEQVVAILVPKDNAFEIVSSPQHANDAKLISLIVGNHLVGFAAVDSIPTTFVATEIIKPIDFILTGQLGFSLLAASVFGVAFVFFGFRQELVLKRFFATPIKRWNILLAEGFSRMLFQLLGALLLIVIGYYVFDFTLSEGIWTVVKLLLVAAIGVMMFMSFGFVISGLAKSNATVPPLANMLVLPQFILAGTFIPIFKFPEWMQWIAKILPLTYLNDAFRNIALNGAGLWDVKFELLVLCIWGIIGYALAARLFKWE